MSAKVTSKVAAKEIVAVKVPAQIGTLVQQSATADKAMQVAATTQQQTIAKLGLAVAEWTKKDKLTREVTQVSLKPLFDQAFEKVGRPAIYAGQQLSRVIGFAFPGGQKASPKDAAKALEAQQLALKENLPINAVYKVNSGSLVPKKDKVTGKTEWLPVKNSNRGGSNAKSPLETMDLALANAITAARLAELDAEQLVTAFVTHMLAAEFDGIDDSSDLKDLIED